MPPVVGSAGLRAGATSPNWSCSRGGVSHHPDHSVAPENALAGCHAECSRCPEVVPRALLLPPRDTYSKLVQIQFNQLSTCPNSH